MTDRELLEMAAKAAGYEINFEEPCNGWYPNGYEDDGNVSEWWNPLADDGDALRLAVKLNMMEEGPKPFRELMWRLSTETGTDNYAATRRAIVRAAAEIGQMEGKGATTDR